MSDNGFSRMVYNGDWLTSGSASCTECPKCKTESILKEFVTFSYRHCPNCNEDIEFLRKQIGDKAPVEEGFTRFDPGVFCVGDKIQFIKSKRLATVSLGNIDDLGRTKEQFYNDLNPTDKIKYSLDDLILITIEGHVFPNWTVKQNIKKV